MSLSKNVKGTLCCVAAATIFPPQGNLPQSVLPLYSPLLHGPSLNTADLQEKARNKVHSQLQSPQPAPFHINQSRANTRTQTLINTWIASDRSLGTVYFYLVTVVACVNEASPITEFQFEWTELALISKNKTKNKTLFKGAVLLVQLLYLNQKKNPLRH